MPYTPTTWVNGSAPDIDAANLNNIETGISKAPYGPDASANFVPVWSGTAWTYQGVKNAQVDAAAAIAYSKLALSASIVNADIAAAAAIIGSKLQFNAGTTPPVSPSTGDLWLYEDAANNIYWLFRYNSAQTTYKWEFVGGAPVQLSDTTGATLGAAWGDTTSGAGIALSRAGDYDLEGWFSGIQNTSAGNVVCGIVASGGTPATADQLTIGVNAASRSTHTAHSRLAGVSASTTVKLRANTSAGTYTVATSHLRVVPVRVV